MNRNAGAGSRAARLLVGTGLVLGIACAATELLAGLGHRLGWWDYRVGLGALGVAAWVAAVAVVVSLVGLLHAARIRAPRLARRALAGLVAGTLAAGLPGYHFVLARQLPRIHDVSTDSDHPPRFVAALSVRRDAPNSTDYSPDTAALQKKAYPDIGPAQIDAAPAAAFERALAAARAMGWEIIASVPADGRIEAVASTLLFGFKDDVVIRVAAHGGGSRVDIRSLSRVGRSDLGANARRIRAFLGRL
ncbi:MAG: DUF1499 domain-containing protein [Betaproteobacteria bacterium]|nr:DUF1499 domain-containing protein [Betaproteobacteria bacterium]